MIDRYILRQLYNLEDSIDSMNNSVGSLDIEDDHIGLARAGLNADILPLGHRDFLTTSSLHCCAASRNVFGCQG